MFAVAEVHIAEDQAALDSLRLERQRAGLVGNLQGQIEVFKDAIKERQRALNINLHAQKLPNWEEEPTLERGEGHNITDGDRMQDAAALRARAEGNIACQPIDQRWRD